MRPVCVGVCLVLAGAALVAQSEPRFEVSSIRASTDQGTAVNAGLRITNNQVRVVDLSLRNYIAIAYQTKPSQVLSPEWTSQLRFDISSNLPAGATRDQVPAMLRSLLEDRFQLKAHRETRDLPVYALTVARGGLKITGTPVDANAAPPAALEAGGRGSGAGVTINVGESTFAVVANRVEVKKSTMAQVAESLTRFTDRTVIDATSVSEQFDFGFDLSQEDYQFVLMRAGVNAGVSLPPQLNRLLDASPPNPLGAYFEKVGLSLEPRRAPLGVVVVESMLKTPTEN